MLISEQLVRRMIRWQLMEGEGKGGGKWKKYQRICGGEAQELYMLGHLMKWLQREVGKVDESREVAQNLQGWIRDLQGYLDEPLKGWKQGNSRLKEIVQAMSQSDGLCLTRGGVARQLHIVLSNILQFSVLFLRSEGKNWGDVDAAVKKISQERQQQKEDTAVIYEKLGSREAVLQLDDVTQVEDSSTTPLETDTSETSDAAEGNVESSQEPEVAATEENQVIDKFNDIITRDEDVAKVSRAINRRNYNFKNRQQILLNVRQNYEEIIKKGERGEYDNLNDQDKKVLKLTIGRYYKLLIPFGHYDLVKPSWVVTQRSQ